MRTERLTGCVVVALALAAFAHADEMIPVGTGNWKLMEVVDVMTDQGRGIAAVDGVTGKSALVVKCDTGAHASGQMYISFISPEYLGEGRNGNRQITVRFDSDAPYEIRASHDRSTASIFNRSDVTAFVKRMKVATKVAIRATSYDYKSVTEVFDITDGAEAIDRAYRVCGNDPV